MRMSENHVRAKIAIVNGMLGHDEPQWNTVGALRLQGEYGGYAVYRTESESGAVSRLESGSLRECALFLSGMIAALRIARDERTFA